MASAKAGAAHPERLARAVDWTQRLPAHFKTRSSDRLQLLPDALLRQVNTQILFMKSAS